MKRDFKNLAVKSLLFLIPFLLICFVYLLFDPFKVVRKYDSFYNNNEPNSISLNRNYIAVEVLNKNNPLIGYDSFIFGSSRSLFYEVGTWEKYIDSKRCIHFDGVMESIAGIAGKINYLKSKNIHLSHVLLVLDHQTLSQYEERGGHLFVEHPDVSGQNRIAFQFEFLKNFLSRDFFFPYLSFQISKRAGKYMKKDFLFSDIPLNYDVRSNEMRCDYCEELIQKNPDLFYNSDRLKKFPARNSGSESSLVLHYPRQFELLKQISEALKAEHAEYKVVISPLYDQIGISKEDLSVLNRFFGEENVFNFSGKNSITDDIHNYYDGDHYRPNVADRILDKIYKKN